jgi:alpha-glucosidase
MSTFGHYFLILLFLVSRSPVTAENATDVTIYLPKDNFYDFLTYAPVSGNASTVHLTNVSFTSIPVHIKGGSILPLRAESANTTAILRTKPFELVVAPSPSGKGTGSLYIDDGVSVQQKKGSVTFIQFEYEHGKLSASGEFTKSSKDKIETIAFLGVTKAPKNVKINGKTVQSYTYDSANKVVKVDVSLALTKSFTVTIN